MRALLILFVLLAWTTGCLAETASVTIRIPNKTAWTGQRLPFFIELHATGSFQGGAAFDLPQVPGAIIIKAGAPVVSSEERDGQSWFVQSHEFSLFAQHAGPLTIPEFTVRFASRDGFTGPASEVTASTPALEVDIRRPPGSENIDVLLTTDSLNITESWTPQPGPAEAGSIFKRTIVQQAAEISGMALAPPRPVAPESIRVYTAAPVIKDTTVRGVFRGERTDTITYQLTRPGRFSLPEMRYVWWNPATEELASRILPAVSFEVAKLPGQKSSGLLWPGLLLAAAAVVMGGIWQRKRVITRLQTLLRLLNPPERVAARQLLKACRQSDGRNAWSAWNLWRNTQQPELPLLPDLQEELHLLQRHLFGPGPGSTWQGVPLAGAFQRQLREMKVRSSRNAATALPELN